MNKGDRVIREDFPILPKNKRVTKAGIIETMGESDWQSPFHLSYPHGQATSGIKSHSPLSTQVTKPLTDRAISNYIKKGVFRKKDV